MKNRHITVLLAAAPLLFLLLDLAFGGSSGAGALGDARIMLSLRLPRALTALTAGAALSIGGLQMQSIFRNPLAEPYIMGVSSGAALGAALATMAGIGTGIILPAFAGAAICAGLVLAVSSRTSSSSTLLIFGIMLGFAVNAAVSILQFCSSSESLKLFYSWSAGSFSSCSTTGLTVMVLCLAAVTFLAVFNIKGLDIILFGDEFARSCGADPRRIKFTALAGTSLAAAAVTAYCGPIGFVGIAGPHIAKMLLHSSAHRHTVPASAACGAALGAGADLLSQCGPAPLPAGSVMALIGIPVVMTVLFSKEQWQR